MNCWPKRWPPTAAPWRCICPKASSLTTSEWRRIWRKAKDLLERRRPLSDRDFPSLATVLDVKRRVEDLLEFLKSSHLRRYVLEPYNTPTEGSGKLMLGLSAPFEGKRNYKLGESLGCQWVWVLTIALSETSNFRMQATSATLEGLPARLRRW